MERQVEHMVRLVDDLLDVSRIRRGKIELRREPVELATVVARAVETSQPAIDAEGHELTVSLAPEPLWLDGDLVRRRSSATYSTTPPSTRSGAARSGWPANAKATRRC